MNVTYIRMDVTSRQNAICPTAAFGRWGHKKSFKNKNQCPEYSDRQV